MEQSSFEFIFFISKCLVSIVFVKITVQQNLQKSVDLKVSVKIDYKIMKYL